MEYSRLNDANVESKSVEFENNYDKEIALVNSMFPNAKFKIAIEYDELDTVITNQPSIILIQHYNCYCYNSRKRITEYYHIKGKHITNKYAIQCLIEQGFMPDCKHYYLESFTKMKNSEFKYEINMVV